MNKGYYSYIKPDTNIKTKYIIEYTQDQKVFDLMDTNKFTFDMLKRIEIDCLHDAINIYNQLYYNDKTLYIMLYEQIILNNEVILEQSKYMQSISILPQHIQNKVNQIENINKELTEQIQQIETALNKYNLTIKQLIYNSNLKNTK